jgi:hypothetical protein
MQGQRYMRGATRLLSVLVVTTAIALPGQAKAIGLFEAIFGPPRPVYVVPVPQHYTPEFRPALRPRARAKLVKPRTPKAVAPKVMEVSNRPSKPRLVNVTLTPDEQRSPLAKFLGDHTLRGGDVVVTAKGPYVFKGSGSTRHRLADFAPAEAARNLAKSVRAKVAEIRRANRWSASLEGTFVAMPRDRKEAQGADGGKVAQKAAGAIVAQDMSR